MRARRYPFITASGLRRATYCCEASAPRA